MASSSERRLATDSNLSSGVAPASPLTPALVLHTIAGWWKFATPVGLILAAVAALIVYSRFVPQYQATAVLMIQDRPRGIVAAPDLSPRFVQNQVELLRSGPVLDPVLADPEIRSIPELAQEADPKAAVVRRLGVHNVGASEMFNVSFISSSAKNSAVFVNRLVDSYLKIQSAHERRRVEEVMKYLEGEKSARALEMQRLRENVRELAKQITGQDPFASRLVNEKDGNPVELQSEVIRRELQQSILQEQVANLRARTQSDAQVAVTDEEVTRMVEAHPEVQLMLQTIDATQTLLAKHESVSVEPAKNAGYQRLQKDLESQKSEVAGLRESLREAAREQLRQDKIGARLAQLKEMEEQIESEAVSLGVYQKRLKQELEAARKYTGDTLELDFLRSELSQATQLFNQLSTNLILLQTGKGEPERVYLWQEARTPTAPMELLPVRNIGLASLLAFFAPFALAVLWELKVKRVTDREGLERQTHLQVLGEIARLPARAGRGNSPKMRLFEESVDNLRTQLLLSQSLGDIQILAITSPSSREGKSSVAAQMALSIARATGAPTLLIDTDMRSPDVHHIFDLELEPGLTDALAGKCEVLDAINQSWSEHLHILPAGRLNSSPHKLVGGGSMENLLDTLRQKYRYIILDTPPVLAAGEAMVLAKAADTTVLCSMMNYSRMHQLKSAYHRLEDVGVKLAGVVINGVPTNTYTYYYGSYDYVREHHRPAVGSPPV